MLESIIQALNNLPPTSLPLIAGAFCFFVLLQVYGYSILRGSIIYGTQYKNYRYIWLSLFLYSIFAYNSPDFLGYIRALYFGAKSDEIESFELIYELLLREIEYNNILFRIISYSITYYFVYKIFINDTANKTIFIGIYIIILLSPISNLVRASIADAVAYTGIFILFKNHKKANRFFKFIIFFSIALTLHKSTFLLLAPLILCFLPFNKNSIRLYLGLYPILATIVIIIIFFLKDYIGGGYGSNDFDNNMSYVIRKVVTTAMTFIVWLKAIIIGYRYNHNKDLYGLTYRFIFYAFLIWIAFLFVPMSHYVAERFMTHCLIPLSLYMSYIIGNIDFDRKKNSRNGFLFFMICYVIVNIFDNIYNFYAFSIHLHGKYEYLLTSPTLN